MEGKTLTSISYYTKHTFQSTFLTVSINAILFSLHLKIYETYLDMFYTLQNISFVGMQLPLTFYSDHKY